MLRKLLLWSSENEFLTEKVARLAFVRRAVRRFMPGETSDAAIAEAAKLRESRITSVLSQLGENVVDLADATAVTRRYQTLLQELSGRDLEAEVSVKLTQLGMDIGTDVAAANLESILAIADEHGQFVWVDIESSAYVDRTLELYRAARGRHANTGLCLQSYLHRTADDLAALLPLNPSIRLVKGAYAEPAEVAFPRKKDVDRNYLELARMLLDETRQGAVRAAFATHDERLIRDIEREASQRGITRGDLEFQMMYGVGGAQQKRLAAEGYRVEVLISYGTAWFPWYMRRLAERPANLWFVMRKMVSR